VTSGPPPYLTLNPASGPATLTPPPTWSASACPSGFQGSAQLSEYTLSGTFLSSISNVVATVTSPFSGKLQGSVGELLSVGGISASTPGTLRWAVGCYSGIGGAGAQKLAQSLYVTLLATGSYRTSGTPPS
jgi:hypothetical protein